MGATQVFIEEQTSQVWSVHKKGLNIASTRKETQTRVTTWRNSEDRELSERSQTQKDKYCDSTCVKGPRVKLMKMENRRDGLRQGG